MGDGREQVIEVGSYGNVLVGDDGAIESHRFHNKLVFGRPNGPDCNRKKDKPRDVVWACVEFVGCYFF